MDAATALVATLPARIAAKITVDEATGCWLWSGYCNPYGNVRWDGRTRYSHRVVYELLVGPIPDGLHIDHLCRTPPCCNPAHLDVVTQGENNRRADGFSGIHARTTHCPQGHAYEGDNVYLTRAGERKCRTCERARLRRHYHATKHLLRENKTPKPCAICGREFANYLRATVKTCGTACLAELGRRNARKRWGPPRSRETT